MTQHGTQNNLAEIREGLRKILPDSAGLALCDPRQFRLSVDGLWPEEEPAIANAVAKRKREFTAGRVMARQAMATIGLPRVAIPMGADRAPVWPEDVVGSISHCGSLCVAIAARARDIRAIGIDVEEYTPLKQDLWAEICTPKEIAWLKAQPHERRGHLAKQVFSAKEAAYKAIFPRIRQVLAFSDLTVDPDRSRASCIIVQNRIVSVWADKGQSPWFSVHLSAEPAYA